MIFMARYDFEAMLTPRTLIKIHFLTNNFGDINTGLEGCSGIFIGDIYYGK